MCARVSKLARGGVGARLLMLPLQVMLCLYGALVYA